MIAAHASRDARHSANSDWPLDVASDQIVSNALHLHGLYSSGGKLMNLRKLHFQRKDSPLSLSVIRSQYTAKVLFACEVTFALWVGDYNC
jgi:hypothetical protein